MTTPSSLEELRESFGDILLRFDRARMSPNGDAVDIEVNTLNELESLFRSHMEAVINEIIGSDGKQTNDGRNGEWIVSVENKLRAEMRQRAKSYLEGEKTNHE